MEVATRYLRNEVVKKISTKGPPHSTRGNPPHLITGQLRRSIATEVEQEAGGIVGRVGTNVEYAKYLELPAYLDRPFLASTLAEQRDVINRLLTGKKIT